MVCFKVNPVVHMVSNQVTLPPDRRQGIPQRLMDNNTTKEMDLSHNSEISQRTKVLYIWGPTTEAVGCNDGLLTIECGRSRSYKKMSSSQPQSQTSTSLIHSEVLSTKKFLKFRQGASPFGVRNHVTSHVWCTNEVNQQNVFSVNFNLSPFRDTLQSILKGLFFANVQSSRFVTCYIYIYKRFILSLYDLYFL